ncbi:hypothetical protein Bca101_062373 [Brassica carinata]
MFCCSLWNSNTTAIVLVVYMTSWRVEWHQRSYAGVRWGHSVAVIEKSWSQFVSKISWSKCRLCRDIFFYGSFYLNLLITVQNGECDLKPCVTEQWPSTLGATERDKEAKPEITPPHHLTTKAPQPASPPLVQRHSPVNHRFSQTRTPFSCSVIMVIY